MQLQRGLCAQLFEQRYGQQAGRMRTEAIGKEADPQPAVRTHRGRRQPGNAFGQRRRALTGAGQLLGGAAVFAEEGERLDHGLALGDGLADPRRQPLQIAPVAQAALPVEQLRGDIGLARQQAMRVAIGIGRRFGLTGVFQGVTKPQGDAGMLRRAIGGLAQQRGRFAMAALHPARAAEPRQCLGMVAAQLQRARCSLFAGRHITGLQLGIGQHHPGNEIGRLPLHGLAQLQALRIGTHRGRAGAGMLSCLPRAGPARRPGVRGSGG